MRRLSFSPQRALVAMLSLTVTALLLLATGCQTPPYDDPARAGPFFTPVNHAGDLSLPPAVRRVVLLPVYGGPLADGETAASLDTVFATELQRQNRFEVVVLDRAECRRRFGADEFSSSAALPRDFLPKLRREFAADAVLWVDLTAYRAYRPLALGVRAKLATLKETRLVWTFDTVFSSDDPAVANAARHHFMDQTHATVPADLTPAVLQSPTRFATYVAAATFATLPPVVPPAPTSPLKPR
ncbi:MAG: hypothetical protein H7343_15580 [Undibacterium sp.]|nr:hypothetical protein [Opitutaceae bacterium]